MLSKNTNQISLKISIVKHEVKDWIPPSELEAFYLRHFGRASELNSLQ